MRLINAQNFLKVAPKCPEVKIISQKSKKSLYLSVVKEAIWYTQQNNWYEKCLFGAACQIELG
jgi:hypothetical protein